MANMRFASALVVLAWSAVAALAEPQPTVAPTKPAVVPDRGLELPFQLRTEPDMKFRGPDSTVSPALTPVPHERLKSSFFGIGMSRPINTGQ